MTGPQHYLEGERLLAEAAESDLAAAGLLAAQAQVHMTAALVAATVLAASRTEFNLDRKDLEAWRVTLKVSDDI